MSRDSGQPHHSTRRVGKVSNLRNDAESAHVNKRSSTVMCMHIGPQALYVDPQATFYRSHITKLCMVPRPGSSVVGC